MSGFHDRKIGELIASRFPFPGSFAEVGAYDGETNSNTCALADAGWNGTYFEPVPEYAAKCAMRHRDNAVRVIVKACGSAPGSALMAVSGMVSTMVPGIEEGLASGPFSEWFPDYGVERRIEVPVTTLDAELVAPIDLLVIDTEGYEAEVIKGFSGSPRLVIAELHELSPQWQKIRPVSDSMREFDAIMAQRGYCKVFSSEIDTAYEKV